MKTQDATGHQIGEIKEINGEVRKVLVGAFTNKNGESFTQLRWYVVRGKDARRFHRTGHER